MTLKLTSGGEDEESEDEEEDDEEEEEEDDEEDDEEEDDEEEDDEEEEDEEEEDEEEEKDETGKTEEGKDDEDKEDEDKEVEDKVDEVIHEHEEKAQTEKQVIAVTAQVDVKVEEVMEVEKEVEEEKDVEKEVEKVDVEEVENEVQEVEVVAKIGEDKSDEDQEQAVTVGDAMEVEGNLKDTVGSIVVEKESAAKYSDSEEEQSEEDDNEEERKVEETVQASNPNDLNEPTRTTDVDSNDGFSQGGDGAEDDYESEGDSDEAVRGSEADMDVISETASDEGKSGIVVDNSELREQRASSVLSDLPSIDELTVDKASQDVGNLEDMRDSEDELGENKELISEVKDRMEDTKEENNSDVGVKEASSEVGGDKSNETKAEEAQGLTE